ncbi:MAG: hypothetical protein KC964_16865, partial [Candidatus Omnitrophica bacterium]|nr:hypothetical protein [Candidatus Omnitrophota bacterium]
EYWLAWQFDGSLEKTQDPIGYIQGDANTGFYQISEFGAFPTTLSVDPPNSRLTSDNWAINLSEADFIAAMGQEISAPAGANVSIAPIISPTDAAFYISGDDSLYANYPGSATLTWYDQNDQPTLVQKGIILTPNPERVRPLYHGLTNSIDLSGAPGNTVVHYNRQVQFRTFDPNDITSQFPDLYVDSGHLNLPAHQAVEGLCVVTFETPIGNGESTLSCLEVVQIIPESFRVAEHSAGMVGHQLLPPSLPADVTLARAQILVGDDSEDRTLYLNTRSGPDVGKVYGVQPVGDDERYKATILFWQNSCSIDWPYTIVDYSLDWPPDSERITHIAQSPPVDLTAGGRYLNVVSWLYQQGAHDPTSGTQFYVNSAVLNPQSEEDETHAVIAVWEPLTGNAGAEIEFLVIDSFHHESPNILADSDLSIPWRVGDRIEDTPGFFDCSTGTHCLDCGDGYIYQGPKQDAGDLFYDTDIYGTDRQLHAGPIFPVNEGMLEVWWYEQKKGICWAYKAKRYDSTWDETVRISGASTDCTECEAEDTTVTQDFSGAGGPSFTLNGTAVLEAGAARLTSATHNQDGTLIFEPVFLEPVTRFSIDFDYLIGGGNG